MSKISLIKEILKEQSVPVWITYCDEHSDYVFEKYICNDTIVASCAVITPHNSYLIVNELDYDNINQDDFKVLKFNANNKLIDILKDVLEKELNFPRNIYLSYSTLNDTQTDILGYGTYQFLTKNISNLYDINSKPLTFNSAENIIYSLFDRKAPKTIERLKIAADRALSILEETFNNLHENMTELDIVNLTHNITENKKHNEKIPDVIDEQYSWKEDLCPIVLVGPSLEKGGHAIASNQKLTKGLTIYFDFGVSLIFSDGEKVSSDLQRMGYFLKDNETSVPNEVKDVFDTLVKSIDIGIEIIKPNLKGYEIDEKVRGYITNKGYPSYNHSTGHSIGEEAHNPGALIGTRESKLANLEIQKFGVYTIEPRIAINNGGSIEEMVYVTENGGVPLSRRQKELYLVK